MNMCLSRDELSQFLRRHRHGLRELRVMLHHTIHPSSEVENDRFTFDRPGVPSRLKEICCGGLCGGREIFDTLSATLVLLGL